MSDQKQEPQISTTGTEWTQVNTPDEDALDLAIMAEAELDFDAGKSAPLEEVFETVRRAADD